MEHGHIDIQGHLKTQTQYFNPKNLLLNGDFEYWYSGTSTAPDAWTKPGDGSVSRESTIVKLGTYSAKLISDADGNRLRQNLPNPTDYRGKTLTLSCWVYASDASTVIIRLYDDITGYTNSSYHTGGGSWELLTVSATIDSSATQVSIFLNNGGNTKTAYFDGAMLVEGGTPFSYIQHPEDHLYKQNVFGVSWDSIITDYDNADYNGEKVRISLYSKTANLNKNMEFPIHIPADLRGKTVVIDECTIYYYTSDNSAYIDRVDIIQDDGDQTTTGIVSHTDDMGNGSSGFENHNIIDSPVEMEDKPTWATIYVLGCDTTDEVRFLSAIFKYHIKVHG
jgi:hypothetical protein